jgi:hypothetical protein
MLSRRSILGLAAIGTVAAGTAVVVGSAMRPGSPGSPAPAPSPAPPPAEPKTFAGSAPLGKRYTPMSAKTFDAARLAPQGVTIQGAVPSFSQSAAILWQDLPKKARLNGVTALKSVDDDFSGSNLLDGSRVPAPFDVEFWHEGSHVALMVASYPGGDWHVHIDDHPVTPDPQQITNLGPRFIDIPFAERGRRKIRITLALSDVVQLLHEQGDVVEPAEQRFNLGVLGDSWVYGSTGYIAGAIPHWIAASTGFAVWRNGQSGTGYSTGAVSQLGFSSYGSPGRLAALKAQPLDALLIYGTVNDAGQSPEAIKAAAQACYREIAKQMPALAVIVAGVEPVFNGDPNLDAINQAIRDAAESAPNVRGFIDWRLGEGKGGWITGTGTVAEPKGDGTADRYIHSPADPHPNLAADKMLGKRFAEALAGIKA